MDFFYENEPAIRLSAFLGIFSLMAVWEIFWPRRKRVRIKGEIIQARRWLGNSLLVVIDSLTLRVVFPLAAVGTALFAESAGYGLFNMMDFNPLLTGIIAFFILDFAIWLEHVASHKIPVLWRIHRVHHADIDLDVTTALRFHPLEIVLSMLWKALLVLLLGAPVLAVLLFEIVLNGMAMFNHSNIKITPLLDRWIRIFFVTPDMHRVHHSVYHHETDSNYGFNLSLWDRLFKTYIEQPKDGHDKMTLGLEYYQNEKPAGILWCLALPFKKLYTPKKD